MILGKTFHIAHCRFTHVYPYIKTNPSGPGRTHEGTYQHMKSADRTGSHVTM